MYSRLFYVPVLFTLHSDTMIWYVVARISYFCGIHIFPSKLHLFVIVNATVNSCKARNISIFYWKYVLWRLNRFCILLKVIPRRSHQVFYDIHDLQTSIHRSIWSTLTDCMEIAEWFNSICIYQSCESNEMALSNFW